MGVALNKHALWIALISSGVTGVMALAALAQGSGISAVTIDPSGRIQCEIASSDTYYYVLYRRADLEDALQEAPAVMKLGNPGRTLLTDPIGIGPRSGYYRVGKFPVGQPTDLDRDGRSDVEEASDLTGRLSPLNPANPIDFHDGVVRILSREMFRTLSYKGSEILRDTHLEELEFVKFYIIQAGSASPSLYFMNTETHRSHGPFAVATGLAPSDRGNLPNSMRGEIVYHPFLVGPDGRPGIYRFAFQPNDAFPFAVVERAYELLAANMPMLHNNLFYYPMPQAALPRYRMEKQLYDRSRMPVILDTDIHENVSFLPLNPAVGYGRLRVMEDPSERPGQREIVLYQTLPNEMSRVGGVVTTVPQTPLSHVNLRAVQDGVPNAFIAGALQNDEIASLIDRYVRFEVTADGYTLEEVSAEEVEAHFADLRPAEEQFPPRDLSVTTFRPLGEISFDDADAFGVKTTNLATLRTFGFEEGLIPDGFGLPFYFYDEFMKFNGFTVEAMLADEAFRTDTEKREATLVKLRKAIKKGGMPLWMLQTLTGLHEAFPEGTSIRCRSSTNNEDLPGFSGAGLYDSYTHHPHEGHLSKSIKQVFASLWNFRAFEEREFYRIDHLTAAMGVLLHPNFEEEQVNGVGVSFDPLYGTEGNYYLNAQVGEDLVTNPGEGSIPEQVLIGAKDSDKITVVALSNQVENGENLLGDRHLRSLRVILSTIHHRFRILYGMSVSDPFAMEIEFKVTPDGELAVKQARPWVF